MPKHNLIQNTFLDQNLTVKFVRPTIPRFHHLGAQGAPAPPLPLKDARVFVDEIDRGAAPGMAVAVHGVEPIGGGEFVAGVVDFPEGVRAALEAESPGVERDLMASAVKPRRPIFILGQPMECVILTQ